MAKELVSEVWQGTDDKHHSVEMSTLEGNKLKLGRSVQTPLGFRDFSLFTPQRRNGEVTHWVYCENGNELIIWND